MEASTYTAPGGRVFILNPWPASYAIRRLAEIAGMLGRDLDDLLSASSSEGEVGAIVKSAVTSLSQGDAAEVVARFLSYTWVDNNPLNSPAAIDAAFRDISGILTLALALKATLEYQLAPLAGGLRQLGGNPTPQPSAQASTTRQTSTG